MLTSAGIARAADEPSAPQAAPAPAAASTPPATDPAQPVITSAPPPPAQPTLSNDANEVETPVQAAAAQSPAPSAARNKPLLATTGLPPNALDLGSEADVAGSYKNDQEFSLHLQKWTFAMKGYMRAPLRIGIGPRQDQTPGTELHSPARLVGLGSGTWEYLALAPNPDATISVNASNPVVSANILYSANTAYDSGYQALDSVGGISQAYLTLKAPNLFEDRGGMSLTVGAFSMRYGNAGPYQNNGGYYSTYLFGRTHLVGENLAADIDLSDHLELVLEDGFGSDLEAHPWLRTPEKQDFFEGQGPVPEGSQFVHHSHAKLLINNWLSVAGHYIYTWSPNDNQIQYYPGPPVRARQARMTIVGGEVHVDHGKYGNGYLGYSHIEAHNLMPLGGAVQVIHGSNGNGLKQDYFGNKAREGLTAGGTPENDGGTIDTLLFQYELKFSPFIQLPFGRELIATGYGMFNHVRSVKDPAHSASVDIDQNKLKVGGVIDMAILPFMTLGFRYDRVMPDLSNNLASFSVISPQAILYAKYGSKGYVVIYYSHFILGPQAYPSSPYSNLTKADPDAILVNAIMSF
jgi:hypothetical protein